MTLRGEQAEGSSGPPASLGSSTDCGCHLTSIRTHGPPVAFTVHLTVCSAPCTAQREVAPFLSAHLTETEALKERATREGREGEP